MKVTNLFKDKVDAISAHQSEFMNWMSPTLRDYWSDFLGKAQNSFLFSKVRDHQQPAVNEEVAPQPAPIVMAPEAQKLYDELSEKIGEFDYVLNQPLYQLIEQVKPKLTKAKIKLSRKLKRK